MKTLEINEEFKRKLLSHGFFNENQKKQLSRAVIETNQFNLDTIHRHFMIDQWLNVLLSNKKIFNENEAATIKSKVNRLKKIFYKKIASKKQNNIKFNKHTMSLSILSS
jgi:putative heme iron utilization protein